MCYIKAVNCGCDRDVNFERLLIKTNSKIHTVCFANKTPCCAYIISDVFGIEEIIQVSTFNYRLVPPGETTVASMEALQRLASDV